MTYIELFSKITELLSRLENMSLCFAMQNFNRGERIFEKWSLEYGVILTELINHRTEINGRALALYGPEIVDETTITAELKGLLAVMEQKDYVLMTDILNLQIKPFLESLIMPLSSLAKEAQPEENEDALLRITGYEYENDGWIYRMEPTSSGLLTLSVTDSEGTYYLHSNANPYAAAKLMIGQYYDVRASRYVIYGLGLGYHVLALLEESHGLVPVTVYESDEVIIELARRMVDLSLYEGRCLEIIYDPDLAGFSEAASSGTIIIHYPSLRNIRNSDIRERMRQLFVQDSSVRNQIGEMLANLRYNLEHIEKSVDAIRPVIEGRDVILVAAGPSLDVNIEELKRIAQGDRLPKRDKPVLICVGTAFRKLMWTGIIPDYVAFLDASERIRAQIGEFENASVSALIASTATLTITRDYAGDKYLICQQGMTEAERYAAENGYEIYESGGSVATVIMDIAVKMNASRVITVGLDLAYTRNKYHADGAGRSSVIGNLDGLVEIVSQDGSMLYTSRSMKMYQEWFEKYVSEHSSTGTEFIDATEGGALINGMKNMRLEDAFSR